jgi:hypothetical protein
MLKSRQESGSHWCLVILLVSVNSDATGTKEQCEQGSSAARAFELLRMCWAVQTLGYLPCDSLTLLSNVWLGIAIFAYSECDIRLKGLLKNSCSPNSALKHESRIVRVWVQMWLGRWAKWSARSLEKGPTVSEANFLMIREVTFFSIKYKIARPVNACSWSP